MTVNHFYQPHNRQELLDALKNVGEDYLIVAGCSDFLAQRRDKAWHTDSLISLCALKELQELKTEDNFLSIGAGCTHTFLAAHSLVLRYFPSLARACGEIGSVQIRNRGTIGGNLINASPAGDTIPCLFMADAKAELINAAGEIRRLPIGELLLGPGKTALSAGEILWRLLLPLPAPGWQNGYWKLGTRGKVTISQIILCAAWEKDEAGLLRAIRLYIGSISLKPLLIEEAPGLLTGVPLTDVPRQQLTTLLSDLIGRITPPEFDRDYKRLAVKGIVHDMLDEISQS